MSAPDPAVPLDPWAALVVDPDDERSTEALVRPMLQLLSELTGLDAVYLGRIDWEDEQQVMAVSYNVDPAVLNVPEGAVVPWSMSLCKLSMRDGVLWQPSFIGDWEAQAAALGLDAGAYVSIPIVRSTDERPFATLCGISRTPRAADPKAVATLTLFSRFVGAALDRDRALEKARARAEQAEQRLAGRIRFAASVEHAMRTPLTVITGWVETIAAHPREEALRDKGMDAIARTADRLTHQVKELLDEARSAIGNGAVEEVDVAAVARELREVAAGHPYSVQGDLRLRTDAVALSVLVEHLVENAVTHTPDGTAIRVECGGGRLVVEDDGPGLPDRDDLFDAFVSADPDNRGTGLGLHIIASIVDRLGATITTGASDSGGARFIVEFADASVLTPA